MCTHPSAIRPYLIWGAMLSCPPCLKCIRAHQCIQTSQEKPSLKQQSSLTTAELTQCSCLFSAHVTFKVSCNQQFLTLNITKTQVTNTSSTPFPTLNTLNHNIPGQYSLNHRCLVHSSLHVEHPPSPAAGLRCRADVQ